jgi:hypothetical protein
MIERGQCVGWGSSGAASHQPALLGQLERWAHLINVYIYFELLETDVVDDKAYASLEILSASGKKR